MSARPSAPVFAVPGLRWGDRPERRIRKLSPLERGNRYLRALQDQVRLPTWRHWDQSRWVQAVRDAARQLQGGELKAQALHVRQHLLTAASAGRLHDAAWVPAVALAMEAMRRRTQLEAFDTQLIAARAVLSNRLAEMATGEGKTLAVGLAACAAALAGMPVHVVTANDYLVARDAERLAPVAAALGLSVAHVVQPLKTPQRRLAYAADITFVTAKELVFDYLRDGLAGPQGERSLRGLCQAIVDEADAVLIDEARVPLILSMPANDPAAHAHAAAALQFARGLQAGLHYRIDRSAQQAALTATGREHLARAAPALAAASASPAWRHRLHREHAMATALAALHVYRLGSHYLVQDGKLVLVDETTGRIAEGRVWSQGLQQLVEIKEGLEPTAAMATIAQLTYQRFFPRYLRLGGLSGTLLEARRELMTAYGLSVQPVPLRQASRRRVLPHRLFADRQALFGALAARVQALQSGGQPVLLAMSSVDEADAMAAHLASQGLEAAVLHARNDAAEADVVSRAGLRGSVTVTTNVSGRGTDILLGEGVPGLGGLHVLSCQLNTARRIDRQLAGRAARQGDPGSVECWWSLQTPLLAAGLPAGVKRLMRGLLMPGRGRRAAPGAHPGELRTPAWAVAALGRWIQAAVEAREREQRRRLVTYDEQQERRLGFVGKAE